MPIEKFNDFNTIRIKGAVYYEEYEKYKELILSFSVDGLNHAINDTNLEDDDEYLFEFDMLKSKEKEFSKLMYDGLN